MAAVYPPQGSGGGGGGLGGATGATDNAILRADGTGGATAQGSSLLIDDSGNLTPTSASGSSVGTAALEFANLYIGTGQVFLGASQSVGLVEHSSGLLRVSNGSTGDGGLRASYLVLGVGPILDSNGVYVGAAQKFSVATSASFEATVLTMTERSSNPTAPAEGKFVIWMSDGTGHGADGDVMIASTAGGVTNYGTLFDHSAGTTF